MSDSEDSLSGFIEIKHKHKSYKHKSDKKSKKRKREREPEPNPNLDESLLANITRYFEEDRRPVRKQVSKTIALEIPDMPKEKRRRITKTIVKHIDDRFISNRAGTKPGDKAWRLELSRSRVEELKPQLKAIRREIKIETPTMVKILDANVSFYNKVEAVRLFDILQNEEPYKDVWKTLITQINSLIKTNSTVTPEQVTQMDDLEKHLKLNTTDYAHDFKHKILTLNASDSIKSIIFDVYRRMVMCNDIEKDSYRKKLIFMTNLPYDRKKQILPMITDTDSARRIQLNEFLVRARERLDERLYGMNKIKDIIINTIHNNLFSNSSRAILALKGPAGIGKTAIASAIAYACDLPFDKVSAGGMTDPSYFKGSEDVWVGSRPQIALDILSKAGYNNPVVLIDELDKAGDDGTRTMAIQNALFELLDSDQNNKVKDIFIKEYDHDLSNIWWIVAINDDKYIHPALKSRLNFITIPTYTLKDAFEISTRYLLPDALIKQQLQPDDILINYEAVSAIVANIKLEQYDSIDIRLIKNEIHRVVACINMFETQRISSENKTLDDFNGFPYVITKKTIEKLISKPTIKVDKLTYYS